MKHSINLETGPRKSDDQGVKLVKALLLEMAPKEAGLFLRDVGYNFPCTMDAVNTARREMNIRTRMITDKHLIYEIGTCGKPGGAGFDSSDVDKADKLEIIELMRHTETPHIRYCLRDKFGELIAETTVIGQNV